MNEEKTPYFVQSVGESIFTTWGKTDNAPEVDHELMASRSGLSVWYRLKGTDKLDGGFERQCERVVSLSLVQVI